MPVCSTQNTNAAGVPAFAQPRKGVRVSGGAHAYGIGESARSGELQRDRFHLDEHSRRQQVEASAGRTVIRNTRNGDFSARRRASRKSG